MSEVETCLSPIADYAPLGHWQVQLTADSLQVADSLSSSTFPFPLTVNGKERGSIISWQVFWKVLERTNKFSAVVSRDTNYNEAVKT